MLPDATGLLFKGPPPPEAPPRAPDGEGAGQPPAEVPFAWVLSRLVPQPGPESAAVDSPPEPVAPDDGAPLPEVAPDTAEADIPDIALPPPVRMGVIDQVVMSLAGAHRGTARIEAPDSTTPPPPVPRSEPPPPGTPGAAAALPTPAPADPVAGGQASDEPVAQLAPRVVPAAAPSVRMGPGAVAAATQGSALFEGVEGGAGALPAIRAPSGRPAPSAAAATVVAATASPPPPGTVPLAPPLPTGVPVPASRPRTATEAPPTLPAPALPTPAVPIAAPGPQVPRKEGGLPAEVALPTLPGLGAHPDAAPDPQRSWTQAPAAAPSAADPSRLPGPAQQVAQNLAALPGRNGGGTVLSLAPAELGRVTIRLDLDPLNPVLHLTVDRPETLDLMRRHLDVLEGALRDMGRSDCTVVLDSRGDGAQAGRRGPAAPFAPAGTEAAPTGPAETPSAPRPSRAAGRLDLRL